MQEVMERVISKLKCFDDFGTVNILHLVAYSNWCFWQKAASAKSSASLNVVHICLSI